MLKGMGGALTEHGGGQCQATAAWQACHAALGIFQTPAEWR